MSLSILVRERREFAREGGFSLLELVVVLGIFAFVVAVSAPWFSRLSRRRAVGGAASEIQTTLLAARMRAVSRNAPASVFFVTATATSPGHLLQTIEPDYPSPTPTPRPTRSLVIPTGDVAFLTLPASKKITFDGNGRRIEPPTGSSADIVIEGPNGPGPHNQVTIRTTLPGRIEVVTPTVWQ